jgi:hypothetical protein
MEPKCHRVGVACRIRIPHYYAINAQDVTCEGRNQVLENFKALVLRHATMQTACIKHTSEIELI